MHGSVDRAVFSPQPLDVVFLKAHARAHQPGDPDHPQQSDNMRPSQHLRADQGKTPLGRVSAACQYVLLMLRTGRVFPPTDAEVTQGAGVRHWPVSGGARVHGVDEGDGRHLPRHPG